LFFSFLLTRLRKKSKKKNKKTKQKRRIKKENPKKENPKKKKLQKKTRPKKAKEHPMNSKRVNNTSNWHKRIKKTVRNPSDLKVRIEKREPGGTHASVVMSQKEKSPSLPDTFVWINGGHT
jgi:hypothetical protein